MFAGVAGQPAEDAWWIMAIVVEAALMAGPWVTGSALDMYKAFDQMRRALLARILLLAGMPPGIVEAYLRFHDNSGCITA